MNAAPEPQARPLSRGSNWCLPVNTWDAGTVEKLEGLPGLRINRDDNRLEGAIDAIAAACHRLGVKPPPFGEVLVPNVSLERLRPYQVEGVSRLFTIIKKVGGALLADDIGLGKSLQSIALAKSLIGTAGRVLIVCPAFVRETWREELLKWGENDVAILGPSTTKSNIQTWDDSAKRRWVVTSYDLAGKARVQAFGQRAPTVLIMDEGHYLKGRDTKRAGEVENVALLTPYKLVVTGTPMWSRPRDFYRILKILFGSRFGSRHDFDFAYAGGRINEYGGMDNRGSSRADELKLRLSHYMVRREKGDVLAELPPLTRQTVWIEPSDDARLAFLSAQRGGIYSGGGAISAALEATLEGKLETAMHLARDARRFVLFTHRREHARQMAKVLNEKYETPCVCITGDIDTDKRQALVRLAEANGHGVVATIDSLSSGVNMQGVATVGIMHSIDWVPLKMAQAEGRLHRMGQKMPVQWIYLAMKDSMDAVVVNNVCSKLDQWRGIMGENSNRSLRDALGDHIDGAGAQQSEAEALKAIYDSL